MANYLVDLYASTGTLFRSERIVADSDSGAAFEAKDIADALQAASFRITRLHKSGNVMVHDSLEKTT